MDPEVLSRIESAVESIRIPAEDDKVYKDECIHSFATNESESGVFVCLNKWWAFGRGHLKDYANLTGNSLFLHIRKRSNTLTTGKKSPLGDDEPAAKVGRKDEKRQEESYSYELIVMPGFHQVALSDDCLPEKVQDCIKALQSKPSVSISDLLLKESPEHLSINEKQYTTEDSTFIEDIKCPAVPNPIFITRWYGKRNSFGRGDNRGGRSNFGDGSNAERDQQERNRKDGSHFRPWR